MKRLRIPRDWAEVTPAWMQRALATQHPDALVSAVEVLMRDDGTNRRARLGVQYAQGSGPARVFVKAHAAHHRWVHLRNGNLFNEARLFASGVLLPIEHPRVYAAVCDWLRLDFLLVMEDLRERQADPRDATRPLSVAQVASGLRGLARLHSQYWNLQAREHPGLRWLKTWAPAQGWQVGLRKRVPVGLQRAAGQLPTQIAALDGDRIVDFWCRYVQTLARQPMTLLHGDAHIGNSYVLPDDTVGFLDWQVVRRGGWSQDVGYFLVGALARDERRRHDAALIESYRKALAVPDAERPDAQIAWLHYRASPAYGLAIWLSTLGVDGYQSREVSLALARRYASAFVELDTAGALRQLGV